MRIKILVLTILFNLTNISCKAQCNNELAIKQFEKDLDAITHSIKDSNANLKDIPSIVERIESVSSIESESDGNYLGKFHPTMSDVIKWKDWLKDHRAKLCWDEKKNSYLLIE